MAKNLLNFNRKKVPVQKRKYCKPLFLHLVFLDVTKFTQKK